MLAGQSDKSQERPLVGRGQRSAQGCLSSRTWEDPAEQRFGGWGVELGKAGVRDQYSWLKWGADWERELELPHPQKYPDQGHFRPLPAASQAMLCLPGVSIHQFPCLGWFPAPPAFLEASSPITPARHVPGSL